MIILALALIVTGTLVWVVLPLRGPAVAAEPAQADERAALEAHRRELMLALQDLDFELQTGKLSTQDHGELRARLQAEAVDVLQRLDAAGSGRAPEAKAGGA